MKGQPLVYLSLVFFQIYQCEISKISLSTHNIAKYVEINLTIDNSKNGIVVNFYEDQKVEFKDFSVIMGF